MNILEALRILKSGPTSFLKEGTAQKALEGEGANYYYNTKDVLKGKAKENQRLSNNETRSILADKKRSINGYSVKSSTGYPIANPGVGFGEPFSTPTIAPRTIDTKRNVESVLGASQPATGGIAPLPDELKKRYIQNFMKYNKGDANYTLPYVRSLVNTAPNYNLDPLMMLSIAALESGWGGTKHGNNLIGYGKTDSGDMGYNFENQAIQEAVNSLLKEVSGAWGGVYTNQTSPQGFVSNPKYKWNYNADWPGKVSGTMNLIRGN